jgi:transposase
MRGSQERQVEMLMGVTTEAFIPARHPIRRIRAMADKVLAELSEEFSKMYAETGRASIPPEHLIKACLLMAFYSIRSERQFCERLQYDLLFKWFLGLNISDAAFDHSTFSKNRTRLMENAIAEAVLGAVVREAQRRGLVSDEHFTVDGTLLQAWASIKSYEPRKAGEPPSDQDSDQDQGRRGKNPDVNFRGTKLSNETHVSKTDREARLARKGNGQETKPSFSGHTLMENRHGLILELKVMQATGTAERQAALEMIDRWRPDKSKRVTLGADKGYDTQAFIAELHARNVAPHVAQNKSGRRSAVDEPTAASPGYAISQRLRKRVEECFGWTKTVGNGRKLRYIGTARNQLWASFTAAAYDLTRMANIEAASA